ncbi:hypothetical protein Mro03_34110 [Microbispora rosea subsp. rosea]|nr:hypothetical protein Mro03_34110 [Microbispora rosea subsp. rosea]
MPYVWSPRPDRISLFGRCERCRRLPAVPWRSPAVPALAPHLFVVQAFRAECLDQAPAFLAAR